MKFTWLEKGLLKKLKKGKMDGFVGGSFETSGGSMVWTKILKGVPTRFKQGPTRRFFNGKENEKIEGVLNISQQWKTDEQKIQFLRKFGWLIKNKKARKYSSKFKPIKGSG